MSGRLVAFVGPSGVGKDSLMRAVHAARPDTVLVRRVITRPGDAGGEDFEGTDEDGFRARSAAGAFLLEWPAHGMLYGIPAGVAEELAAGRICLANLSRGMLEAAAAKVPALLVVHLTASPEVLAARLAARGRESAEEILARLDRRVPVLAPGLEVLTIVNDGPLQEAVDQVLAALAPVRA